MEKKNLSKDKVADVLEELKKRQAIKEIKPRATKDDYDIKYDIIEEDEEEIIVDDDGGPGSISSCADLQECGPGNISACNDEVCDAYDM